MGVPRFYRWLKDQRYKGVIQRKLPAKISSLMLDMNGILHQVAQQIYAYGDGANPARLRKILSMSSEELLQEYFQAIGVKLLSLIYDISPDYTLLMAVDGVAPQAKISQQRSRRYKNAKTRGQHTVFDSNSITPGTNLMYLLDNFLEKWISANQRFLPPKVIYSSHMVPGEGEHKIMDMIRNGELLGDGAHVLYGLDADLIMLSLIAPVNKIYLKREDLEEVVVIDNLRTELTRALKSPTAPDDFIVFIMLIGNDFLPHQSSMDNLGAGINALIKSYLQFGRPLTKRSIVVTSEGETEKAEIIWDHLIQYLSILAKAEPELLTRMSKHTPKFPSPAMEYATETIEEIGGNLNTLTQMGKRSTRFNFDLYRNAWYTYIFTPKDPDGISSSLLAGVNILSPESFQDLIEHYFLGMYWTYAYYTRGTTGINIRWYYPYLYAPLITDLDMMTSQLSEPMGWQPVPGQKSLNPIHQLLSVIPPASSELIPLEVRHLVTQTSDLSDLYPTDFIIDLAGKNAEWQGFAILPFVDPDRIIQAVRQVPPFTPDRIAVYKPKVNLVVTRDHDTEELVQARRQIMQLARPPERQHRTSDRQPRRTSDRQPHRTSDRQPHRTSDRQPHRTSDRQPRRTSDRQPRRTSDRQPRRTSDRQPRESRSHNFTQTGRQISKPDKRSMTRDERIAKWNGMPLLM